MEGITRGCSNRNNEVLITENRISFHRLTLEAGSSSSMDQSVELRASSSNHTFDISSHKRLKGVKENRAIVKVNQVEQLDERLRFLEEETTLMKRDFWETIEERNRLMMDIYREMQAINNYLQLQNQERGAKSSNEVSIVKSAEEREAGILQVLSQDSNPLLVMRNIRAKATDY